MTAEVIVMNKIGIAMAADSAVTMSLGAHKKIYNTTDKIFALSRFEPVGFMCFGNAAFMGMPWEPIVKVYRDRFLGSEKFHSLKEYTMHFIKYLKSGYHTFINDKASHEYYKVQLDNIIHALKKITNDQVDKYIKENGKIGKKKIRGIILENLDRFYADLVKSSIDSSITKADTRTLLDDYNVHQSFINIFRCSCSVKMESKLKRILIHTLTHFTNFITYSGIVVAGYGTEEMLPCSDSFLVEGIIAGKLKHGKIESAQIDLNTPAQLRPFAQSDMVRAVMEGIDPNLDDVMKRVLSGLLKKLYLEIGEACPGTTFGKNDGEAIQELGRKIYDKFVIATDKYKQTRIIPRIMTAVSALPKSELAVMAETLVNLTSFKRKFSIDMETVGGPIDVAVLSKGDGFVWVKRKQYFDSALNYQYMTNHLRGCMEYEENQEK